MTAWFCDRPDAGGGDDLQISEGTAKILSIIRGPKLWVGGG